MKPGRCPGGGRPGRVGDETTGLRVLQPSHRELRVPRSARATMAFMLSGFCARRCYVPDRPKILLGWR